MSAIPSGSPFNQPGGSIRKKQQFNQLLGAFPVEQQQVNAPGAVDENSIGDFLRLMFRAGINVPFGTSVAGVTSAPQVPGFNQGGAAARNITGPGGGDIRTAGAPTANPSNSLANIPQLNPQLPQPIAQVGGAATAAALQRLQQPVTNVLRGG